MCAGFEKLIFITILILLAISIEGSFAQTLPEGFSTELVLRGGQDGIAFVFDPDGHIFLSDKNGKIMRYADGTLTTLATLSVKTAGESGLLGITLDPEFEHNKYIYVYYTLAVGAHNRLSRFQYLNNQIILENEEILLDLDPVWESYHNGGALGFGPDGKLYVSTGDGLQRHLVQSHSSLLGKILRLNPDGTIPTDNPFYFSNEGIYKSIYALGFRNPFTFSFSAEGKLFVNDVGEGSREEINDVHRGGNYGWPLVEGKLSENPYAIPPDDYMDPIYAYAHDQGCAITGSAFYQSANPAFPESYNGKYFFSDFCNPSIKMLDPVTLEVTTFLIHGQAIAMSVGPGGDLFFLLFPGREAGEIWKVSYAPDGPPTVALQPESVILQLGEKASFEVSANGKLPLSYQWSKNGVEIPGATEPLFSIESVTLSDNGAVFTCVITNEHGYAESNSALLTVTDRSRPMLTIDVPMEKIPYTAGDTIIIRGTAIDEVDGELPVSSLKWRVDFHHGLHFHPFINTVSNIDSLQIIVPRTGETSPDVWYRIHLSADNSIALSESSFVDIFPKTSTITLTSNLGDPVPILLDGISKITPHTFTTVSGMTRNISTSQYNYQAEELYSFDNWNDEASESSLVFNAYEHDTTFIANFIHIPWGEGLGLTGKYYSEVMSTDESPAIDRIDNVLDFDWQNSEIPDKIETENFYVFWTGFIKIPADGMYTFYAQTDGGVKVSIAETSIFDYMDNDSTGEFSGSLYLKEGLHPVSANFHGSVYGSFKFSWSGDDLFPKIIVPQKTLYDASNRPSLNFTNELAMFALSTDLFVSGEGTDSEGVSIPQENFVWTISYGGPDNATVLKEISGTDSLNFILPDSLSYLEGSSLIVKLQVTDNKGFAGTVVKTVDPDLDTVKIESELSGFQYYLNKQLLNGSHEIQVIDGFNLSFTLVNDFIIDNKVLQITRNVKKGTYSFQVLKDTTLVLELLTIPLNDGTGLTGEYFSGENYFGSIPDIVRIDSQLDFNLENQSQVRVKWYGALWAPLSDNFIVNLDTKGHAEMRIFGTLYDIEDGRISTNSIFLETNQYYPIEIRYETINPGGEIKLSWESTVLPEHTVPMYQLYPDLITDIPELYPSNVKIYPNPATDIVVVELHEDNPFTEIRITNILGESLWERKKDKQEKELVINMSHYDHGMYFLHLRGDKFSSVFKIIKE